MRGCARNIHAGNSSRHRLDLYSGLSGICHCRRRQGVAHNDMARMVVGLGAAGGMECRVLALLFPAATRLVVATDVRSWQLAIHPRIILASLGADYPIGLSRG
jgi:hypothetical protein